MLRLSATLSAVAAAVILLCSGTPPASADVNERQRIIREMRACLNQAAAHELAGDRHYTAGAYAAALKEYEASFGCEGTVPRPYELAKAGLAACRAGDGARARRYYPQLSYAHRQVLEQACAQRRITLRAAPAGVPAKLDADTIGAAIEPVVPRLQACIVPHAKSALGGFQTSIRGTVAPDGSVARVDAHNQPYDACVAAELSAVRFPATTAGGPFAHSMYVDPSCQPVLGAGHAERWYKAGKTIDAVRQYVDVSRCRPEPAHLGRGFEIACEAKLAADATLLYAVLDPAQRSALIGACTKQGIAP